MFRFTLLFAALMLAYFAIPARAQFVADVAADKKIEGFGVTYGEILGLVFDELRAAGKSTEIFEGKFRRAPSGLGAKSVETAKRYVAGDAAMFGIAGIESTKNARGVRTLWLLIATVDDPESFQATGLILAAFRISGGRAALIDVAARESNDRIGFGAEFRRPPSADAVDVYDGGTLAWHTGFHTIVGLGRNGFEIWLDAFPERHATKCDGWTEESARMTMTATRVDIVVTMKSNEIATERRPDLFWRKQFRHSYRWDEKRRRFALASTEWKTQQARFLDSAPCEVGRFFSGDRIPK